MISGRQGGGMAEAWRRQGGGRAGGFGINIKCNTGSRAEAGRSGPRFELLKKFISGRQGGGRTGGPKAGIIGKRSM